MDERRIRNLQAALISRVPERRGNGRRNAHQKFKFKRIKDQITMVLKTAKSHESVRKGKPASPDFWSFLEEIDAPQWVDLALEANSSREERDDSWFHMVHPFHQRSFHDLVSPSPLGVKVKGKVSRSVNVSPNLVNLVSKSRGKPGEGQAWHRNKAARIKLHLSEGNNPCDRQTRHLGGKVSSLKSSRNIHSGSKSCLQKPSNDTATKSSTAVSTISGNELKNPSDAQIDPSTVPEPHNSSNVPEPHNSSNVPEPHNSLTIPYSHNPSIVSDFKAMMPRASGLLSVLKMSSLRRSGGAIPALRVEVKEEQLKERKSSSSKLSTGSSVVTTRKTSSIGSSNSTSQQVKKGGETLKTKNQAENNNIYPIGHNRKKSSIGSSSTVEEKSKMECEMSNARNKGERTSKEPGTKSFPAVKMGPGQSGKSKTFRIISIHTETASRKPLRELSNLGTFQQKSATVQNQRFAGAGKENNKLGTTQNLRVTLGSREKPLTSINHTTHEHADQGQSKFVEVTNVGYACTESQTIAPIWMFFCKIPMGYLDESYAGASSLHYACLFLQNEAITQALSHPETPWGHFVSSKLLYLGSSNEIDFFRGLADFQKPEAKLKGSAQSKGESTLHSIKDIKKWERNSGRSYFCLNQSQREKANREIENSKARFRQSRFSLSRQGFEAGPTPHPHALMHCPIHRRGVNTKRMEPRSGGYQPKAAAIAPNPRGQSSAWLYTAFQIKVVDRSLATLLKSNYWLEIVNLTIVLKSTNSTHSNNRFGFDFGELFLLRIQR
eukprot:Gb_21557 [translate_table: standard]